jgi:hypothetical protein
MLFNQFFAQFHHDPFLGLLDPFTNPFGIANLRVPMLGQATMALPSLGGWPPMMTEPLGHHAPTSRQNSMGLFGSLGAISGAQSVNFQSHTLSSSMPGRNDSHWTSESRVTKTVNGMTETVIQRRDAQVCPRVPITHVIL